MSQVEFLFALVGMLAGVVVSIPVAAAVFQTRAGCKAMHAVTQGEDNTVCLRLAGIESALHESLRSNEQSRRIQFAMLRAIISHMELPAQERERILNMQG